MAGPGWRRFGFRSRAFPEGTFEVLRFEGEEALSRCYRFTLELVSARADLDLRAALASAATFTMFRPGGEVAVHGMLASFEQLDPAGALGCYRATLVPRLESLAWTCASQIHLGRTIPQCLLACLEEGGLSGADVRLHLLGPSDPWEFICQYEESHLDFFSRWTEQLGLYYFFEQGEHSEQLVVTDSLLAHRPMAQGGRVRYRPPAGLDPLGREEAVLGFRSRQCALPRAVLLRDHNDQQPSLELAARAEVGAAGHGLAYAYGEPFRTLEEGRQLARIRAEEWRCGERRYFAETSVPFLRSGYLFELEGHPGAANNQEYLAVAVRHRGSQAALGPAGWSGALAGEEREATYRNTVEAIPAAVQFRPGRRTPRPAILGGLPARVDAEGSGAELDGQGRYKVILAFDRSGRQGGKASAWLRLLQPCAGAGHGMHLPLHKGTEVMVAFAHGDPDRPFIAGAVPNPEAPSVVTRANPHQGILQSAGRNRLLLDDQPGQERLVLESPKHGSYLHLGAAGGSGEPASGPWNYGATLFTLGKFQVRADVKNDISLGLATTVVRGSSLALVAGAYQRIVLGRSYTYTVPAEWDYQPAHSRIENLTQELTGIETKVARQESLVNDYQARLLDSMIAMSSDVLWLHKEVEDVSQEGWRIQQLVDRSAEVLNETCPKYTEAGQDLVSETKSAQVEAQTLSTSFGQLQLSVGDYASRQETVSRVRTLLEDATTQRQLLASHVAISGKAALG